MEEEAKLAQMTAQFMGRVNLQGNEVMAYISCMQWLEAKAGAGIPAPADPPEEPPKQPAKRRAPRKG
jgi:hypothetical protein